MRWVRAFGLPLLVFTAVVVQRSGAGDFSLLGVHPDFVMLMVAAVGVYRGREVGALTGFFAGLVVDSFLTTPFGISALVLCVVGYVAGEVERVGATTPLALKILIVGAASVLGEVLSSLVLYLLGIGNPLQSRTLDEVIIVGGINLVLAPLALGLCRLVFGPQERTPMLERR
ncbi:rod shape-determining protein MreD [Ferrimicrobium acidiphilum]|jgi:rod shape-determining protein MreD|uniref:Rod shape-determining protein MreD n=1 Tax=Ferrimicrobium acidiphilum DSM 19497 TaxID=1121877 RepID=A0A0D8FYG7_9ACTN|nr:rod shape-determining protein MreD [Ferrimicrobium acidiphilum]KJE78069.1 rod shape-determining protein MreD [Ferrimicrobium acidiphilum DSM 19497]MCL5053258.1 rod shape-determining protein MreD [Gammaproteobacteria bacterium]